MKIVPLKRKESCLSKGHKKKIALQSKKLYIPEQKSSNLSEVIEWKARR